MSQSLNFSTNEANAYIQGSDLLGLTGYPFTFAFWAKVLTPIPTNTVPLNLGNPTDLTHFHEARISDTLFAQASRAEGSSAENTASSSVSSDVWHHVAVVWASATERRIYVNGVEGNLGTTSRSFDADPALLKTSNGQFTLGSRAAELSRNFEGLLAHIGCWDVALTAQQISDLSGGTLPSEIENPNLRAYWTGATYNDGGNTFVEDFSGNNYNLLVSGGVTTSTDVPDVDAESRKITITDLKAPNDANEQVANATGVQVKLWIDKEDVDAPDVLVTDATITGGTLSVTFDSWAAVGDPVLGVAKWTAGGETYFFPIDTTVQEDV